MKKGFGLIEVLFAAVVLGFLIVGLTRLQMGNRESILRIRARDAANTIAQDVIDSISALGSTIVNTETRACNRNTTPPDGLCKSRKFKGLAGEVNVNYDVKVEVVDATEPEDVEAATSEVTETEFTKAQTGADKLLIEHKFAKQVTVTVSWNYNKTTQSINVSSVIR